MFHVEQLVVGRRADLSVEGLLGRRRGTGDVDRRWSRGGMCARSALSHLHRDIGGDVPRGTVQAKFWCSEPVRRRGGPVPSLSERRARGPSCSTWNAGGPRRTGSGWSGGPPPMTWRVRLGFPGRSTWNDRDTPAARSSGSPGACRRPTAPGGPDGRCGGNGCRRVSGSGVPRGTAAHVMGEHGRSLVAHRYPPPSRVGHPRRSGRCSSARCRGLAHR